MFIGMAVMRVTCIVKLVQCFAHIRISLIPHKRRFSRTILRRQNTLSQPLIILMGINLILLNQLRNFNRIFIKHLHIFCICWYFLTFQLCLFFGFYVQLFYIGAGTVTGQFRFLYPCTNAWFNNVDNLFHIIAFFFPYFIYIIGQYPTPLHLISFLNFLFFSH